MKRSYPKILRNRKARIQQRLGPRNWEDQSGPMFQASNLHYELAERVRAVNCGSIVTLQECFKRSRQALWKVQPEGFLKEAFLDVDGTIAGTYGECKAGIGLSYKGIGGYAPLIVSLANTKEVLYLINRPGQSASHSGSVEWIDRAADRVV